MDTGRTELNRLLERARRAGPAGRLVEVTVAVARQVSNDDVFEMAAGLAYRFFLSIFPFAIFLGALGGFVALSLGIENPARQIVDSIGSAIPEELSGTVTSELSRVIEQRNAGLLTIGGIAAMFFASGGMLAVIKATNRAYGVEESRPFLRRYAVSIGLTILAGAGVILAFVIFVTGQLFATSIAEALGQEERLSFLFAVVRWPAAFVLLYTAILLVYRLAPNLRLPWRHVAAGSVLFTAGWLSATWLFAWYVSNLAGYGATFGALAGVAILMVWFYLTALILLIGAELNAVLEELSHPEELQEGREEAHRRAVLTEPE